MSFNNQGALTTLKFLTDDEAASLVKTLESFGEKEVRNTTLIFVSYHTGARPSEVLGIRKCDLHLDGHVISLIGLKGSKAREIPVHPWLFRKLAGLAAQLPSPEARLFPISLRQYERIWDQYKPCDKPLKSLRHTFAINIYKKTKDIRLVKRALGHRWLSTTEIYTDYVYNQEEFRKLLL